MKAIQSREQFGAEVIPSKLPVVVKFWAPWCAPCLALAPKLDALAVEYAGRAEFVSINSEAVPEVARQFHVRSLPTVLILKGGSVADVATGLLPLGDYVAMIERAL